MALDPSFSFTASGLALISAGELCNKGYSRMNEFEAHEASYEHGHTKVTVEVVCSRLWIALTSNSA